MKKILIATHNPGKIAEYKELLADIPVGVVTLADIGITDAPSEDGDTFEENARAKAAFYSARTNIPLFAEDSGIEIDALGGAPGVHSRRWGSDFRELTDEEMVEKALHELKGVPWDRRGAQFRVVIAFQASSKSGAVLEEGMLRGFITERPMAAIVPGYPFRSLFYIPEKDDVLGKFSMEEEARIAHRGQALKKLLLHSAVRSVC